MYHFSECVSPGHPDKIADFITSYLLDRYIEKDPSTRYAVEVQIKNNQVTLGGEVRSSALFTLEQKVEFIKQALDEIGYTPEYQKLWGKENTISSADINESSVHDFICEQSPEIAQGVDNDGWGDQGIFFGMAQYYENPADNEKYAMMPIDFAIAKHLNHGLFTGGFGGLDIKTEVIYSDVLKKAQKVIVAIPLIDPNNTKTIEDYVKSQFSYDVELIVNGTGSYKQHGPIADCGTTGRKLAVDFYGGGCKIGGGSVFTKDGTKADVSLNLYARMLAKSFALKYKTTCYSSLACCIGKPDVDFVVINSEGKVLKEDRIPIIPKMLVNNTLELNKPIYASMCDYGLFGEYQQDKNWEKDSIFQGEES